MSHASNSPRLRRTAALHPRADFYENDQEMLLVVDLPGVASRDLTVQVERGMLFIEGTRPAPEGQEPTRLRRAVALRGRVDPEGIQADLRDGVLTVHLPRAGADRPHRVPVADA
jgi:HSP20 family protein